ncbi:hypothetical protein RHMOL_Rhmol11G0038900 [Rhododendron molle]|uniref:Uncharacterized protein n=1 Tax=Rhododendron molle TaxID=49168 RepID=A0ACC0LQ09_RHOML|nr:hypothetical protein RHMOL_Rhmol11G0038900 [Rhododendron molle]
MLSQREESSQSGVQWTPEGMSGDVLGKRKRSVSTELVLIVNARDEELQNYKANMEKMEMEREEDKKEREQERREREEEKRQREEERRKYEAG